MEAASTGYGYLLYSVQLKNYHRENKLKVVEASDYKHWKYFKTKIEVEPA